MPEPARERPAEPRVARADDLRPDDEVLVFFRMPVTAFGLLRGAELAGAYELALTDDEVLLEPRGDATAPAARRLLVLYGEIDGVRLGADGGSLALFLAGGDVLELTAEAQLSAAAREITRRACEVPELTRPLRALGSHRRGASAEHERFFGVLLEARRVVERGDDPARRLEAFDGARLGAVLERTLAAFAAERHPASDPDRRALEEALRDEAAPLVRALGEVDAAAARVRESDDDARFARWRDWTRAVHRVFETADRVWLAMHPLLAPVPARRPSLLRRLFRLGAIAGVLLLPSAALAQRSTYEVADVRPESLLARGFDVVGEREGRAIVVADSADLAALGAIGRVERELVTESSERWRRFGSGATTTTVFRPFDDPVRGVKVWLDSLARANPGVHLDTIGTSFEGRPILAVKIGAADDSPSRPNVLYMATYHAREWMAAEMALRLVRHLSAVPAPSARVDSLVAARDVWIIPVVNPDGYQYTFTTQRLWRKNRRPFTNAVGVDLNRNHASHWGWDNRGSSPNPASEVYRGPSPASELETQAVQQFHAVHRPVLSVSYHTFTGLVLYPPGYEYGLLPGDLGIYRALAGTDVHPAVIDRLPGAERTWYHPAPSWNLYVTNGDYNDWAYETHGTLSFTPELTSGFEHGRYYGFEFPDDEAKIQRVFEDNLPFALDVLEAAREPLGYRSPNTGLRADRLILESVSPVVRAIVPKGASVQLQAGGTALAVTEDTADFDVHTRRVISAPVALRPSSVTVRAGVTERRFQLLAATGAEPADTGWTANGFLATGTRVRAGTSAWIGSNGTLRSPVVRVPAEADTVSVVLWTSYDGDAFSLEPHAEIRVSTDGGATWTTAGRLSGYAPVYYTEFVRVPNVAGRQLQVELAAVGMQVFFDEVAVVAHVPADDPPPVADGFAPSANPVRGASVAFSWPFADAGEVLVYDFTGRLVTRIPVGAGASSAEWNVGASGARNGAYVAVARSGSASRRVKLFVLRGE